MTPGATSLVVVLASFVQTVIGRFRYVGRTNEPSVTMTPRALRGPHVAVAKLPVSTTPKATLTDWPLANGGFFL